MYWDALLVGVGIVTLVISSLFLISSAILALISHPSQLRTQHDQVFVIFTILMAVSGISMILSGRAKKERQE